MKIKVALNAKSIDQAIKTLKQAKQQLKNMVKELLVECCNALISLANGKIELLDIGSNVKLDLQANWIIGSVIGNKIILTNTSEKAVYVEFGVGIIGQQNPHDNASMTGYQYNVKSSSKLPDDSWMFSTTLEDLDLPKKDVNFYNGANDSLVIETKGTPATMFLYQSIIDFKDKRIAKNIWDNIKKKYWG